ncbi:unannotated protein [freshwater metagenome]|uniref:Unannotated protein n=1 Tax=freshwater metagenome TaxID=449393 RepID=A0A6J7F733_9ZZZZ
MPEMVKEPALSASPPAVATLIEPVVAPVGTTAVIEFTEATEYAATIPLKPTDVAAAMPVPVMVTAVPAAPEVGVKLVITGAGLATHWIPPVLEVMVPVPVPEKATESSFEVAVPKAAPTRWLPPMGTVQVEMPLQSPDQPMKL